MAKKKSGLLVQYTQGKPVHIEGTCTNADLILAQGAIMAALLDMLKQSGADIDTASTCLKINAAAALRHAYPGEAPRRIGSKKLLKEVLAALTQTGQHDG